MAITESYLEVVHLCLDEAALKISVDRAGSLRSGPTIADSPALDLYHTYAMRDYLSGDARYRPLWKRSNRGLSQGKCAFGREIT